MNPFDLRGPEFLGFYLALAGGVLFAGWVARVLMEGGDPPRVADPYLLALLRGGRKEAVAAAMLALTERGALTISSKEATRVAGARPAPGLERAILDACSASRSTRNVELSRGVQAELMQMEARLAEDGLLADAATKARRVLLFAAMELVLAGVAATKIVIALQRGRANVEFLVVLAVLASIAAKFVVFRPRTAKGTRLLADLRTLLEPLRARCAVRRATRGDDWPGNVALLAAVYGPASVTAIPADLRRALWPAPVAASSSDGGSSGSSCGAGSGGSSCGGGCGGGGCGGCGS